jgi:hypothetical protein
MKAKEIAEQLLLHPDFDVEFRHFRVDGSEYGATFDSFKDIHILDIGHSNKIIVLGGNIE